MNKHILRIVKTYDDPFDCEDCGTCYPEGLYLEYNGEVIWEKFSDGHYSGSQTEDSILTTILNKWYADMSVKHEYLKTEQQRLEWNKNHPGNGIAKTTESWLEHHAENFSFVQNSIENIKSNCVNLPYEEVLQIKMIALWFESEIGEVFDIEVETEKYQD